jgi:hypothetical protein
MWVRIVGLLPFIAAHVEGKSDLGRFQ